MDCEGCAFKVKKALSGVKVSRYNCQQRRTQLVLILTKCEIRNYWWRLFEGNLGTRACKSFPLKNYVKVFKQPNYLQNFVQSTCMLLELRKSEVLIYFCHNFIKTTKKLLDLTIP